MCNALVLFQELAPVDDYFNTIFLIWGMVTGIIKLASEKEAYLLTEGKLTKEQFLREGFEKIFKLISR